VSAYAFVSGRKGKTGKENTAERRREREREKERTRKGKTHIEYHIFLILSRSLDEEHARLECVP